MSDKPLTPSDYHNMAMERAERALLARIYDRDASDKRRLMREALFYERKALEVMAERVQPTWSVLCRSAGTMALDCRDWKQAVELARMGLTEDCPGEIAREIEALLRAVGIAREEWARGNSLRRRLRHMNGGGVYGRRRRGRGARTRL